MKNIRVFHLKIFSFLEVKFTIYLNRRVFVMVIEETHFCRDLGIYVVWLFWYQNTWLLKPKFYCLNHFKTNGCSLAASLLFILLNIKTLLFLYRTIIVHNAFYRRVLEFIEERILRDQE